MSEKSKGSRFLTLFGKPGAKRETIRLLFVFGCRPPKASKPMFTRFLRLGWNKIPCPCQRDISRESVRFPNQEYLRIGLSNESTSKS